MNKNDIKHVLTALGSTTFNYSGESVMTNCPLAKWTHESGSDSRPSFGIKEGFGMSVCHCFTCGFKGGLVSLVFGYSHYAIAEGLMTRDDVQQLIDFIMLAEDEEVEIDVEVEALPKPSETVLSAIGVWHDYFAERGITEDSFRLWHLGYYENSNRVIFPVFYNNEVVGIVGRAIDSENPVKYKNDPPRFKKSNFLYGLHLMTGHTEKLIVVEGPIDAIKVNQYCFDPDTNPFYWCVALMGSEPSKTQMDLLVENAEEVICMLDNDASGKKGQKELLKGIGRRTNLSFVEYPEGVNDPDEAGRAVIDMINNRSSSLSWQIDNILRKVRHG